MNQEDRQELRQLAEAAAVDFGSYEPSEAELEFMGHITPAAALSLLGYVDSLEGLYRMHKQTETREMLSLKAELKELRPKAECVDDCAHLILKLVHCRRQLAVDVDLADRAMDYLKRNGLQGNPLRADEASQNG